MAEKKAKAADAPEEGGGKGNKKFLIIAAAGGGVLLVVIGVLVFLLMSGNAEKEKQEAEAAAAAAPPPTLYASLGDKFVSTLSDGGQQRYFQVAISVMAREQAVIDEVGVHAPLIRSKLVSLLATQDFAALRTDEGRQALRGAVLAAVQEILQAETGKPGVEQVFFTEFVLQ